MSLVANQDHGTLAEGSSLFVWKASCFSVSCFFGCASSGTSAVTVEDEMSVGRSSFQRKSDTGAAGFAIIEGKTHQTTEVQDPAANSAIEDVAQKPAKRKFNQHVSMVGIFSDWKYGQTAKLDPWMDEVDEWPTDMPARPDGMIRMKKVVKMTSASFSFQVVCPEKEWDWRLYPRDFQAVFWGAHVSKQGVMKDGVRNKVIVGVGDKKKGDGKNLHVVSYKDDIVTIWMDMPVKPKGSDQWELDTRSEDVLKKDGRQPVIWFTMMDKTDEKVRASVQLSGGDGKDIESYRSRLAEV